MKKIFKLLTALLFTGVFFPACAPEEFSLGNVDVQPGDLVEGIAFKIEHDTQNPNIVRLTSLMGSQYTPLWDHPQGRSQDGSVSLRIPFPGTYTVKFGVQTRGGIVYGEPASFTVTDFHAPFVQDEMWTLLSGGVDQEKTWYLDLDEEGLSRHFLGPLYFYGTDNGWLGDCKKPDGDCWNWSPDYKGNSWLMPTGDYGSMTFDLKGAANVRIDHKMITSRGTETGFYMLDTESKTMRLTDASPLHDSGRDGQVIDWGNIQILSLTENHLQLGVFRDPVLSGEGAAMLVYNYISKDFRDNWTPSDQPDPEPPYDGDANDDLTTSTTTTRKWALSISNPYDWTNLAGELLNEFATPDDYVNSGWAPYDEELIRNISLTLSKTGDNEGSYIFTDGAAVETTGTYTVDDKNNIIFDQAVSFPLSGWISLSTTSENALRILRAETDATGNITGIWLGQRDPAKEEYLAFHFVLQPAAPGDGSE